LDSIQISVKSKRRFKVEDPQKLAIRRTTPTNSIENVPELLKTRPARDLAELLMGQIPGLRISSGPNGVTANIRGINTITGNTEPLIVVDGMTYDSFSVVNSFLDVHSIQSIQVQKDGGMYGMRGANGVIIVTTKGSSANPLSY
jgi:TonB-dependent SusC/RagA subfamily outer membrane receptor